MISPPSAVTAEVPLSNAPSSQLQQWSTSEPKRQYIGARMSGTLPLPASSLLAKLLQTVLFALARCSFAADLFFIDYS